MIAAYWIITTFVVLAAYCDSHQQERFGFLPEPVCGNTSFLDACFQNTTQKVTLDLLHTAKVPETVDEISKRCEVFNRGMACVQRYVDSCLDSVKRRIIENEVYGAKKLYAFLCQDRSFQREFLKHKTCFFHVQNHWNTCSRDFVAILQDEMEQRVSNADTRYLNFCCARYGYENCVYNSAALMCTPESARFLRKIAMLLSSDKHFQNCDRMETMCSSSSGFAKEIRLALIVPLLLLALLLTSGPRISCITLGASSSLRLHRRQAEKLELCGDQSDVFVR
ncbi:uncharacterized protein LOC129739988 [Uranotaenia lowii]|uniref:uncharacterized protein LOC129739988 n=1 Tax=Uranotaenia lowii TaxID=190385 RepID=UPI00247A930F|nr:uncharacterized protein LOC129739988 [Uranotaenia lowii]XP_055587545.1 uncharacterized protein LOC129739988 [Uranotaenia lowii]